MKPEMFKFTAERCSNGDHFTFLGQGNSVKEAFADGIKNVDETYRPSSDGKKRPRHGIAVTRWMGQSEEGLVVNMTLAQFEAESAPDLPVPVLDDDLTERVGNAGASPPILEESIDL